MTLINDFNDCLIDYNKTCHMSKYIFEFDFDFEFQDVFEVQKDAAEAGQKVIIVDDLLATGGVLTFILDCIIHVYIDTWEFSILSFGKFLSISSHFPFSLVFSWFYPLSQVFY